jgi:transcription antitermination factor NusG
LTTFGTRASVAHAGNTSEPSQQLWFATYTCSCQEKRVAQHLSAHGIEFFLPVYRAVRRWKNGVRALLDRPLFPGYLFVKIDRRERVRVLDLPGVHSLVGVGREPIPLPNEEIEALRQGIHLFNAEPHPFLNVGDRARLCRGPLEGFEGIIARKKNGHWLVLSIELIMRSIAVEVNESDLEPIGSWPRIAFAEQQTAAKSVVD